MKRKRKIDRSKVLEKLAELSDGSDDEDTVREVTVTNEHEEERSNEQEGEGLNELTLEINFGTYIDDKNVECPRKYGLKVFPSRTFAEDMASLDSLRKMKRVRSNFIAVFDNFIS